MTKCWSNLTDMKNIYANIIVALSGVAGSFYLTTRENSKRNEMKNSQRADDLMSTISRKGRKYEYAKWKNQLRNLSTEESFEFGKELSVEKRNDVERLLNYYLTHPCMDYIKLNDKGDGCDALFGNKLSDVHVLNNLLYATLGSYSMINEQHDKESICVNHLQNYESFAAIVVNNSKIKNSNGRRGGTAKYHTALISLIDLRNICIKSTGNEQFCNNMFPKCVLKPDKTFGAQDKRNCKKIAKKKFDCS